MSIKRYLASKDNTISTAFKVNLSDRASSSNMGASDILEIFSIYGQASSSSLEQSRILVEFPIDSVKSDRSSGKIPESGSVTFKLKMFNAEHGQTTPSSFTLTALPLVRSWTEGSGLDMESYLDKGTSNWYSSSAGNAWYTFGGDYLTSSVIQSISVPYEYTQNFNSGLEDIDIDISPIVEEWVKNESDNLVNSTGSFSLVENLENGDFLELYTYDLEKHRIEFASASFSVDNTYYIVTGSSISGTLENIKNALDSNVSLKVTTIGPVDDKLTFIQNAGGIFGNTIITSSVTSDTGSWENFTSGSGAPNYGFVLRLSGSYETGLGNQSYYTKKFFARSSHHYLEKPIIEAQWDSSIKDDRASVIRSSSLAPASENLNNIYLYNKRRNGYVDIPSTGSSLVVKLVSSLGGTAVGIDGPNVQNNYITASKHSTGIYKASFAYEGSQTTLYDIWQSYDSATDTYTDLFTGSAITINSDLTYSYHEMPNYVVNITNLKSSYSPDEVATFRIYTRDKNWSPNLYTVATQTAPVDTMRNAYYKIVRASDRMVVIDYSTSSVTSYSELSYDSNGSYFDLDMSILEPNYLYEISFLRKDGNDYIEQKEKFKFRVDPSDQ